ncbi:9625_t:CDS:1, partial [Dentiscutata heterogama]
MPQSQTSTNGNSSPTIAISNTISTTQLPKNNIEEIRSNAIAQKKAIECKQLAEKELIELEFSYNISPNIQLRRE